MVHGWRSRQGSVDLRARACTWPEYCRDANNRIFLASANHEPGTGNHELFHSHSLRLVLDNKVKRTPRANPSPALMKSKRACGMTIVANNICVTTGSQFWTTMIATNKARIRAAMSLNFCIPKASLREAIARFKKFPGMRFQRISPQV
jgi:hypothetical protein